MSACRFDLIALGECMVELYATQPLGSAEVLHRSCGGDVLNALVAAARMGARTGFVTRVGDDPFGPALLAQSDPPPLLPRPLAFPIRLTP